MKGDIIPNGEILYRYIKPQSLPPDQDEIPFSIFDDPRLSCDWAKYQESPEESYHISEGKNSIIQITICDEIKFPTNPKDSDKKVEDWKQKIYHDPIEKGGDQTHPELENFSHSLIEGSKKKAVTNIIAKNSKLYKTVPLP